MTLIIIIRIIRILIISIIIIWPGRISQLTGESHNTIDRRKKRLHAALTCESQFYIGVREKGVNILVCHIIVISMLLAFWTKRSPF